MDLKIVDKKEQPMLSRIEIAGKIDFEGPTPSMADVKKALSSELKVDEGLIVVRNILNHFGKGHADLVAYTYLNKEDMVKVEIKTKKQRKAEEEAVKKAKEAKKKAEAPSAAEPAEKKE